MKVFCAGKFTAGILAQVTREKTCCINVFLWHFIGLAALPFVRHGFAVQPHVALHASTNAFAAVDQCILKGCYTCVEKHIVTEMEFHPVIHSLCGLPPCWARS